MGISLVGWCLGLSLGTGLGVGLGVGFGAIDEKNAKNRCASV